MSKNRKGPEISGLPGCREPPGVDRFGALRLPFQARLQASYIMDRAGRNEADIQAAQSEAHQQARVSGADEDRGRSAHAEPPAQARTGEAGREDRRQVARPEAGRGERLPREARIRLGADIRGLLERGRRRRTENVDVFFAHSSALHSRLGVVVPKHGHKIVERNRVKRRLREIGRRWILPELDASGVYADVLLRARRSAYSADFGTLEREVRNAVEDMCSRES